MEEHEQQDNGAAGESQPQRVVHPTTLESALRRLGNETWLSSPTPSVNEYLGEHAGKSASENDDAAAATAAADEEDRQISPLVVQEQQEQGNQQQGENSEQATIADLVEHIEPQCHTEIMFAAGLSYFSDAINIMATFFLALPFEDHGWQSATVASSVFMGSLLGSYLSSCYLSERFGSQRIFVVTSILRPIFGMLTLGAVTFPAMVTVRFLVGTMSCGRLQAFQVLDEFSSTSKSKTVWIYMQFFWAAGVIAVSVIESILSPDWRGMVIWTEILVTVASILGIMWLPESPSWLLRQGNCEKALISIGSRTGPGFDWLVAIQPNPPAPGSNNQNRSLRRERLRLWSIWYGFGSMYFGSLYLINTIFHGSNDYYGTIMASAELEILGVAIGWFGATKIGSRWVQIIGFFVGGLSVTFVAAWEEDHALAVAFSVIGRLSLMAAITSSFAYAMEVRVSGPVDLFAMMHLGALGAPFFIDGSGFITVCMLAIGTLFLLYCSWFLPEKSAAKEQLEATMSFL